MPAEMREFLEKLELIVRRTAVSYTKGSSESVLWLHLADEINKALKDLPDANPR